jgi:hypothetical protein
MLFGDLIAGRRHNCADDFGCHRQRFGGIHLHRPLTATTLERRRAQEELADPSVIALGTSSHKVR